MALTDQVIMPGSDYQAICNATRKLTGETATLKSGEISTELDLVTPLYEMWVLSKEGVAEGNMNIAAHFYTRTLDEEFTRIIFSLEDGSLRYIRPDGSNELVAEATSQIGENEHQYSWVGNPEYRAIVCKTPPTGALLTWLQANGVKQASYTAVETNHTCSGTVFDLQNSTITSEAPYDAMQRVTLNITIPEQEKTVSPTETSQTVTPDTHKVLSKVTVNPISPTYVGSAIPRQPAKTITPSSTSQMAVRGESYVTGTIYVDPVPTETKRVYPVWEPNERSLNIFPTNGKFLTKVTLEKPSTLISSNIKKDVNIGGVIGTFEGGVDLPFTKLTTVSTDNGILSFSFTGYYDTIIAKRSGTNKILTAVFGNNLKASFSIESEGSVLSTSAGFSYNQVGNKFNITWNISNSSGSVWYEGSYEIYGCNNG